MMDVPIPHFPVTITIYPAPDDVFAEEAATSMVGNRFFFAGVPVEVHRAHLAEDGSITAVLIEDDRE